MVILFKSSDFVIQADEEGITVRSVKDKTLTTVAWDKVMDAYEYFMDSEGWE